MSPVDAAKAAVLLLLLAIAQVTILNPLELVDGPPDVLLLALVAVALLRGPVLGAAAGFWAGLVLDTATLGTLGLSSLLLTLVGYWLGRYGEGTSVRHSQLPRILIATAIATVGFAVAAIVVHFMLGTSVPLGPLLSRVVLPQLGLNVLLAYPVFLLVRRIFPVARRERPEVILAG